MAQKRPYEGLKVLDATHVLAGPDCGYLFALLGAETIKIESPHAPDPVRGRGPVPELNAAGLGINYLIQNSNKRAIGLDLKTPQGKDVFLRLARDADILIENFRTGAYEALGLGYEDIRAINPGIIYCSITAFGGTGPLAERTGYDPVLQCMAGIAQSTGLNSKGVPAKSAAPMIDYGVGMAAAFALASAVFHRERTGEGQKIDCSMYELALVLMGPAGGHAAYAGEKMRMPQEAATDIYRVKDAWLQLGAYNFRQHKRLWETLGHAEFAAYTTWPEIWDNAPRIRAELERVLPEKSADEWETYFNALGIPAARVRTLDEAVNHEQVRARGFLHELPPMAGIPGVKVPVAPFAFASGGPRVDSAPPEFGAHSDDIARSVGYDDAQIAALRQAKALF